MTHLFHKWINLTILYVPSTLLTNIRTYEIFKVRGCNKCLKVQIKYDGFLEFWKDCRIFKMDTEDILFCFDGRNVIAKEIIDNRWITQ